MAPHLPVNEAGHIRVKGSQQLPGALDDRYLYPQLCQIFGHFQADEASAGQHRRLGLVLLHKIMDAQRILDSTQGEYPLQLPLDYTWNNGLGTGREDQLIIRFRAHLSGLQRMDRDCLSRWVNGRHLMPDPNVDAEALPKAFRGL